MPPKARGSAQPSWPSRPANRFRRRREEQARTLIEEAAEVAARVLEPWRGRVEFVALGGDRSAVDEVLKALKKNPPPEVKKPKYPLRAGK